MQTEISIRIDLDFSSVYFIVLGHFKQFFL